MTPPTTYENCALNSMLKRDITQPTNRAINIPIGGVMTPPYEDKRSFMAETMSGISGKPL